MNIPIRHKDRVSLVNKIVDKYSLGDYLSKNDNQIIKYLFINFYTPPYGTKKTNGKNIINFSIGSGQHTSRPWNIYGRNMPQKCIQMHYLDDSNQVQTTLVNRQYLCGAKRTIFKDLNEVFRFLIADQIETFFLKNNGKYGQDEVDHIIPFRQLFDDFLKNIPQERLKNLIIEGKRIQNDDDLCAKWQKYHQEHATLQLLSRPKHKEKTKKDYKKYHIKKGKNI